MRTAFIRVLSEVARSDDRVFLVVGDVGYSVVEPFAQEFPSRFLNAGVAEQNLAAVAAGLALSGRIVFAYSIANFPTLRCLEQIRNDICYHRANVKIVAVGGGLAYGSLGFTHHATEDLAIMRTLPEMDVVAPGDPIETALVTRAIAARPGPGYLRLGKAGEAVVHSGTPAFDFGEAIVLTRGSDVTFISTGGVLSTVVEAASVLRDRGVSTGVVSMPIVKPFDTEVVRLLADECPLIVTVEEHTIVGGLGSAVSEVLAEQGRRRATLKRVGLPDGFCREIGTQEYLRNRAGLSVEQIVQTTQASLTGIRTGAEATLLP